MERFKDLMKHGIDEYVYPVDEEVRDKYLEWIKETGANVEYSLKRQYLIEEENNPVLRISSIGKTPACELVAKKLGLLRQAGKHTVSERQRLTFCFGDYVEQWLSLTLLRFGYKIKESQTKVTWNGVDGHIDFLVEDTDGKVYLLECKSANDYYFKSVSKYGIGNERGYLTQLSCYHDVLKDKYPGLKSFWIFVNKNTSEVALIEHKPEHEKTREALQHAASVIKAYNKASEPDDLWKVVQPPPPTVEVTRTGEPKFWEDGTPKMYVPSSVIHSELFYVIKRVKTDYGKLRDYVIDYKYPEHLQEYKPDIIFQALNYGGH